MYKKAMIQNLEFIADSEAFKKISDKKAYQITFKNNNTRALCCTYESLINH
jgi:hypothetical protein